MAHQGLKDIFIANEIVGSLKLQRLKALHERVPRLAVGVDHPDHLPMLPVEKAISQGGVSEE
jgi:D-serine deaminase-like pyridoxal phosphate-dependent protein